MFTRSRKTKCTQNRPSFVVEGTNYSRILHMLAKERTFSRFYGRPPAARKSTSLSGSMEPIKNYSKCQRECKPHGRCGKGRPQNVTNLLNLPTLNIVSCLTQVSLHSTKSRLLQIKWIYLESKLNVENNII